MAQTSNFQGKKDMPCTAENKIKLPEMPRATTLGYDKRDAKVAG
ncbi:hypothetical protein RJP21_00770 [Paenibacillus sp. VCA1]|nr:hypothetical protein [Paenibacillus sp. VCA1]MDR9852127.1 hypothetical protein [Paenibacillus sp. VCA1]